MPEEGVSVRLRLPAPFKKEVWKVLKAVKVTCSTFYAIKRQSMSTKKRTNEEKTVGRIAVDDFIIKSSHPDVLQNIREAVLEVSPELCECISYGMPCFWLGENLFYYNCAKNHYAIYPTANGVERFLDELSDYSVTKGTIKIKYSQPIPKELIQRIVLYRLEEVEDKNL